ncbi:ABC transporter permease [Mycolicibacterium goodii]|uniref:Iron ABC transporter permease n=1 Tax=Mycolicibacterium goodii TaxID=134601 RepID=A0ABS6HKQ6_MYCGD|nr:iron ABC transporter permease [Mycolicibacterium goodii]MBU8814712.1 iron ABC transporter permease [Mycolicibacterium goodii]MBU8822490.1 iron ABC transporter permease [Mycolicibacterium goodii]MBU8829674.1 iron ABC transporter permease [Mycolicibacterium goodii]MBU8835237.1 iron ABC transporter permease [Mycolicibacterium goodii]
MTTTATRPVAPTPPIDITRSEPARWRRWLPTPKFLILGVVAVVIAYLAIVPLYYLFWGTFFDASGFTLSGFQRAYGNDQIFSLVGNSLWFAAGAAIVSLVIGTGLAYLNVRTDVPFKALFFAASIIPLVIPGILYTIAWILLGSPDIGLINHYLEPIFGDAVIDVFSVWGMIWVEGLQLSPIVFLLMVASFRSMDPSLEESALMSGASRWTVFFKVTVPLARPAIVAAILIMVVRSLESFEVPALLGLQNGIYVFTSRIYFVLRDYPPDLSAAGALAIGLLAIAIVGVMISNFAGRAGKNFQTVTGKGFRPRPIQLGKWRPVAGVFIVLYFLISVVAPLLVLLYTSLLRFYAPPSKDTLSTITFDNYRQLMHTSDALTALKNSLILGLSSATLVMAFMAVAAWIVVRSKIPGRKLLDGLAFMPLIVPGLVMGLALSFVYLRSPIPIYGTLFILLISYCTRYLPYGMRYSVTSMQQISNELEESALVNGASWWQTFRRVLLPLLMPGLIAGWIYILVVSFRELSSSILLYSPGNEVLSILIFEQFENGQFTVLSALGVVMVLTLVVLVTVAYKLGAKVGLKQD